ncbi:MAG TPA: YceH family protein [Methylibium sp.]
MSTRSLTPLEARIVAVLLEKQHTVPDSYPLSLNALLMGCNQKTAREPVMNLSEAEVLGALDELRDLSLVVEVSGSRVARYEHNLQRVLGVPSQSAALLAVLMLRGPQTAAELRQNSERLHRFADISSVEAFLAELAEADPPKVVKLPRASGEREARWAHLLCGEVQVPAEAGGSDSVAPSELAALRREQQRLSDEVEALRGLVERLYAELGVSKPDEVAG